MDLQANPGAAREGGEGVPAEAPISVVTTGASDDFASVSQAARALAQARRKRPETSTVDTTGADARISPTAADEQRVVELTTDQPRRSAEASAEAGGAQGYRLYG